MVETCSRFAMEISFEPDGRNVFLRLREKDDFATLHEGFAPVAKEM